MTAREYLHHITKLRHSVLAAKQNLEEIRGRVLLPASPKTTTIRQHNYSDHIVDNLVKVEAAETNVLKAINAYYDACFKFQAILEPIELTTEGYILMRRFLDDQPLPAIARELELSTQYVRTLSSKALHMFEDLYDEQHNN